MGGYNSTNTNTGAPRRPKFPWIELSLTKEIISVNQELVQCFNLYITADFPELKLNINEEGTNHTIHFGLKVGRLKLGLKNARITLDELLQLRASLSDDFKIELSPPEEDDDAKYYTYFLEFEPVEGEFLKGYFCKRKLGTLNVIDEQCSIEATFSAEIEDFWIIKSTQVKLSELSSIEKEIFDKFVSKKYIKPNFPDFSGGIHI